jgi:hypothetical protein
MSVFFRGQLLLITKQRILLAQGWEFKPGPSLMESGCANGFWQTRTIAEAPRALPWAGMYLALRAEFQDPRALS